MNFRGLIYILMGSVSLLGALRGYEWFVNHPKARFVARWLTPRGARIFYAVVGIILIIVGTLLLTGVIVRK